MKAPILDTRDFRKTFIVECDALRNGISVILMKEGRPLAFKSKPIKGRKFQKPIYEKEILESIYELKKWPPYLINNHFNVKKNHDSLEYFLEQILSSEEKYKWAPIC